MGAAASTGTTTVTTTPEWTNILNIMQLSKYEITAFDEIFRSVDVENTGSIDVGVMLNYLGTKHSFFSERIFIYDEQCLGRIDFFEFVLSLWKFCSFNKESMAIFAFNMYDTDQDGVLTETEARVMFHDLYWHNKTPSSEDEAPNRMLNNLLPIEDNLITLNDFCVFVHNYDDFLRPLYLLQDKFHRTILNKKYWKESSARKVVLGLGRRVVLGNVLVEPMDRELFHQLLQHSYQSHTLRRQIYNILYSTTNYTTSPTTNSTLAMWLLSRDSGNTSLNSPDFSDCYPDSSSFRKPHIPTATTTDSVKSMKSKVKQVKAAWSTGYSSATMRASDCSLLGESIVGSNN